ncbi:MAG: DUF2399 domain-containing protein [Stellaceae bacterium]
MTLWCRRLPGHRSSAAAGLSDERTGVLASWDEELTSAMKQRQLAIAEEAVADSLVQDLDESS